MDSYYGLSINNDATVRFTKSTYNSDAITKEKGKKLDTTFRNALKRTIFAQ